MRELSLSWANGLWRARGEGLDLEHAELRGIEALVEQRLAGADARAVAMRFDFASFPAWMRQHQSHYFTYTLRLEPLS
jgi:hypothetical protein